jgi:hypothetical protein
MCQLHRHSVAKAEQIAVADPRRIARPKSARTGWKQGMIEKLARGLDDNAASSRTPHELRFGKVTRLFRKFHENQDIALDTARAKPPFRVRIWVTPSRVDGLPWTPRRFGDRLTMMRNQLGCARRSALKICGLGLGLVGGGWPVHAARAGKPPSPGPVIAYFADGLLRDPTGTLPAYRAPRGYRGGAGIAALDERQLREAGYLV